MYVEIVAGTGIGQFREIVSNTATVLTVSAVWTTNPDATSEYRIFTLGASGGDVSGALQSIATDRLLVEHTDGSNTMPTMDNPVRRGYIQLTNGTVSPNISLMTWLSDDIEGHYGLTTNSLMYARISDSQTRMLNMDDTASRNLYVSVRNGANKMPAGDTIARSIYVKMGSGVYTAEVASLVDDTTDIDNQNGLITAALMFARVGSTECTNLHVDDNTNRNLYVTHRNGANKMPAMDDPLRRGYVNICSGSLAADLLQSFNAAEDLDSRTGLVTMSMMFARIDDADTRQLAMDDTANRNLYVSVRNGANKMPAMDVAGRKGYVQLTDGVTTLPIYADGGVNAVTGIAVVGSDGAAAQILSVDSNGQVDMNLHTGGGTAINLGTANSANSLPVTMANDQAGYDVTVAGKSELTGLDTYTTTNTLADAMTDLTVGQNSRVVIVFENTHGSNSLDYVFNGKARSTGIAVELASGTAVAGDIVSLELPDNVWDYIELQAKATVPDSQATMAIDWYGFI